MHWYRYADGVYRATAINARPPFRSAGIILKEADQADPESGHSPIRTVLERILNQIVVQYLASAVVPRPISENGRRRSQSQPSVNVRALCWPNTLKMQFSTARSIAVCIAISISRSRLIGSSWTAKRAVANRQRRRKVSRYQDGKAGSAANCSSIFARNCRARSLSDDVLRETLFGNTHHVSTGLGI